MAVIAEFTIPVGDFAFSETLKQRPELEFRVDSVVAHNTSKVTPFVRATHGDLEELTQILNADSSVEDVDLLAETDDELFYRMVWTNRAEIIGYMVAEQGATIQEATASDGEWHLRVFFPDRDNLAATDEYATKNEVSLEVVRIYSVDALSQIQYNLTDEQHEALVEAVERGYYDVPRKMTAEKLSNELGISHQALSERFRRGVKNLITSTLLVDGDEKEK